MPPLALYIHIPWCVRKCPYCDFNSHAVNDNLPEQDYVTALLADLEQSLDLVSGRPLEAIFIGGGTPSLFSPSTIDRLLNGVSRLMSLPSGLEVTLEANPGAVDDAHFPGYRAAGVNRLSLGAQSFENELLQQLGRIHSGAEVLNAFECARSAGFENINLDLMFGLPGQTPGQALADLRQAIALGPEHLSWYQLTIEPNTLFHHRLPHPLPDEERLWAIQEAGQQQLADRGYRQYEVSAYARDGSRCRHNLNYWRFGDYLGIGAGAHSKLSTERGILRFSRQRQPEHYMATAGTGRHIATESRLLQEDLRLEFMLNAMRLNEGVPTALFTDRTGLSAGCLSDGVRKAQQKGLMEQHDETLKPTPMGRNFLNDLLMLFQ